MIDRLRCVKATAIGTLVLMTAGIAQERPIAWTGGRVLTVSGAVHDPGTLVVHRGLIRAVGSQESTLVPPEAEVREVTGRWIMPGLVDTHSHIGGISYNDLSAPIQPDLRVLDMLNVRDPSVAKARAGGITTVNIMTGSGLLCSGQTLYVKLRNGRTVSDLLITNQTGGFAGGLKMANGTNSRRDPPFPGSRAKSAALVREKFVAAREYQEKIARAGGDPVKLPARDLGLEILVETLEGKRVVHHHTHRHDDIVTVLRLQKEFGFRVVLHHVSDAAPVAEAIAAAGAPCSVILVDSPGGKLETRDLRWDTPALLDRAGVVTSLHTDDPITDSRLLLRSAALAVRAGMSRESAYRAVTLHGAIQLDLQSRVGSLEPGKDADFLILSGDPLSVYTEVLETWIEGNRVFDRANPQDRLWATGGYGAGNPRAASLCCYGPNQED